MKKSKTLQEYTKDSIKTLRGYDKTTVKKWDYRIDASDLSVQLGSLTKALMQYENTRFAYGMTKKELKSKIGDELADILTEVLFIAHELNIDIEESFDTMLASDKEKVKKRI